MKTCSPRLSLSKKHLQNWQIKLVIISALKRISEYLRESIVGRNELRVWQTSDHFGNQRWHAYDPVTGRHTTVNSEAELRAWIERRYYN